VQNQRLANDADEEKTGNNRNPSLYQVSQNLSNGPPFCADNFQGLPPEAIPAFLQNLQNSAGYNIAKPIARPAAYHPYHRPSHQPPQRHLPPNAHHTLQQLFYRGPYLTGNARQAKPKKKERKKMTRYNLQIISVRSRSKRIRALNQINQRILERVSAAEYLEYLNTHRYYLRSAILSEGCAIFQSQRTLKISRTTLTRARLRADTHTRIEMISPSFDIHHFVARDILHVQLINKRGRATRKHGRG